MAKLMHIFLIAISSVLIFPLCNCAATDDTVTNQQIRDSILSIAQSYTYLDNKLDRHEQRERALGDVVKRALLHLQKGQKIFEPMQLNISRLDVRMNQVETLLIDKEEKVNEQQLKIVQSLDTILKWINDNSENAAQPAVSCGAGASTDLLEKKIDALTRTVESLQKQIVQITQEKEETSKGLLLQAEKLVNSKLASADEVISALESKLSNVYVVGPNITLAPSRYLEWEESISKQLKSIDTSVNNMKNTADNSNKDLSIYKDFFIGLSNETLTAIHDMRTEVLTASDKSFTKTATRIKEAANGLDTVLGEVLKTVQDYIESADTQNENVTNSISSLHEAVLPIGKLEKNIIDIGDSVLSIKRGIEFNVHAIVLELSELVQKNSKEVNHTLYNRFDAMNKTIVNNHNGVLVNLTSKIETEISQAWRQIGSMFQEVASSKAAINKLQEQTEGHVNGTLSTMNGMEIKIVEITGRMTDVGYNLTFLLGKLSQVTQEFNKIITGIEKALNDIHNSFEMVQKKIMISEVGPGPYNIQDER